MACAKGAVMSVQPPPEEWTQAVGVLGHKLLALCLDCPNAISAAALIETLILVLLADTQSPDAAKRVLRSLAEGAEIEIDEAWAAGHVPPWTDEGEGHA